MFLGNGSTLSGKSIRVSSAILNKTIDNSILPSIKEVPMESIALSVIEGIHQLVAGLENFLNLEDCLEKQGWKPLGMRIVQRSSSIWTSSKHFETCRKGVKFSWLKNIVDGISLSTVIDELIIDSKTVVNKMKFSITLFFDVKLRNPIV